MQHRLNRKFIFALTDAKVNGRLDTKIVKTTIEMFVLDYFPKATSSPNRRYSAPGKNPEWIRTEYSVNTGNDVAKFVDLGPSRKNFNALHEDSQLEVVLNGIISGLHELRRKAVESTNELERNRLKTIERALVFLLEE